MYVKKYKYALSVFIVYHCVTCGSANSLKCYRFFAKNVYMLTLSGFRVDLAAVTTFPDVLNRRSEAELVAHIHIDISVPILIKMDMYCCIPSTMVIRLLDLTLELTNSLKFNIEYLLRRYQLRAFFIVTIVLLKQQCTQLLLLF